MDETRLKQKLESYISTLDHKDQVELKKSKSNIIKHMMNGKFADLGGLIAMRGFIYQYYVTIFYILKMFVVDEDVWWDQVVLEFFDDVALIKENKIRFIQVKTIREKSNNKHIPSDFTNRKVMSSSTDIKSHFNSWIDKIFLNYDNLASKVDLNYENLDVEFEIITNSPTSTLSDLEEFTTNINFYLDSVSEENKVKKNLSKSIIINSRKENLSNLLREDLDFYLKRLYINQFGSTIELQHDILDMIIDIYNIKTTLSYSIAVNFFENMFQNIIHRAFNDNEETLNKNTLVIKKNEIKHLMDQWYTEACEIITSDSLNTSALGMFDKACNIVIDIINQEVGKESVKQEIIRTYYWFKKSIDEEFKENPSFCIEFLNKLYNVNYGFSIDDYGKSINIQYLSESILYLVYFLSFYSQKYIGFKETKLNFHIGESDILDKVNFSVCHSRSEFSLKESKNKVISLYKEDSSYLNNEEILCLILGSYEESENYDDTFGSLISITETECDIPTIVDTPDKVSFLCLKTFKQFIGAIKHKDTVFEQLQGKEDLNLFKSSLDKMIKK